MNNSQLRKLVVFVLFFGIILAIIFGVVSYLLSFQKLNIVVADKLPITVGIYGIPTKDGEVNAENYIKKEFLVREMKQSDTIKLKKGRYVVYSPDSTDFKQQKTIINLSDTEQTVRVDPTYSIAKLKSVLAIEKASIRQAIIASLPTVYTSYGVKDGVLYDKGDWYGTTISPKLSDEQVRLSYVDIYRLVAHKENGVWKIITLPPELIVNHVKYPNIPREVLVDLNKQ